MTSFTSPLVLFPFVLALAAYEYFAHERRRNPRRFVRVFAAVVALSGWVLLALVPLLWPVLPFGALAMVFAAKRRAGTDSSGIARPLLDIAVATSPIAVSATMLLAYFIDG